MSSCGSNCSCGTDCKCGSNGGCSMHLDIENSTAAPIVVGVAPSKTIFDGAEKSSGAEGGNACKCGSSCTCDPCNC